MPRRFLSLLLFSVIVTRLPFLLFGYGTDPDAWRVANVAQKLWQSGQYEVSRFPGYPLHEIISGPLIALGQDLDPHERAVFSNGGTLLATLVLLLVWAQFVRRVSHRPHHLVIALAFTPLLWYNSAATMDYVWSLLFMILALNAAHRQRTMSAGVWLGIAVGFRPSNLVVIVPLVVLLLSNRSSTKAVTKLLAAAALTTVAAYLPILLTYGLNGWLEGIHLHTKNLPSLSVADLFMFVTYRSVYAIGPLASIVAASVLLLNGKKIISELRPRDPAVVTALVGLLVFILTFLLLPVDRSYLLPALPFLLLLVERFSSSRVFAVFIACLVLHGFVNIDVIRHEGARGKPEFNIRAGLVIDELQKKMAMMDERIAIARLDLRGKAIVMTGTGPSFWFQNDDVEEDTTVYWRNFNDPVARRRTEPEVRFIPLLTKDELGRVRSAGYNVYCLENDRAYIESEVGYSMDEEAIPILAPNANKL